MNTLKSCPFCGAGETLIVPNTFWTGRSSQIISVEVRHWCSDERHKPYLCIKGKTEDEAIERWNRRHE